jgi:hypothetical protein
MLRVRFEDLSGAGVVGLGFDGGSANGSARARVLRAAMAGAARRVWPAVLRKRRRAGELLLELFVIRSCFRVRISFSIQDRFGIQDIRLASSKDVTNAAQLTKFLWDSYETFMRTIRLFYPLTGVLYLLAGG